MVSFQIFCEHAKRSVWGRDGLMPVHPEECREERCRELMALLVNAGFAHVTEAVGATLDRLWRCGCLAKESVLLGHLAFQCYQGLLGRRLEARRYALATMANWPSPTTSPLRSGSGCRGRWAMRLPGPGSSVPWR
jgi:hypothetical protein